MWTSPALPTILFPDGFDDRHKEETRLKGYLGDVVVRFADGTRY